MAKIKIINTSNKATLKSPGNDLNIDRIRDFIAFRARMLRRGRKIRSARNADKFALPGITFIQPDTTTMKSKMFQGSRMYVHLSVQKPIPIILISASIEKSIRNIRSLSSTNEFLHVFSPVVRKEKSYIIRNSELIAIRRRIKISKYFHS